MPTLPRPYGVAELAADPIGPNSKLGTYTNFVNLLDLCALAVPGPFRADGFPAGTTLIAPRGSDAAIASIGRTVHAAANLPLGATKATMPPLAKLPVRAEPGEFELCVVGAHLSGMPLNKELKALGARLLRAVGHQGDLSPLRAARRSAVQAGPAAGRRGRASPSRRRSGR